ncbi:putative WRKY transcription factor 4 [Platanthera zijinensis]|uniref:WRKY transcription factor 4 n=1 Tax=Platanthera zijinensis TaxID=2320716 RepID=A0AAP0BRD2_9ASPA
MSHQHALAQVTAQATHSHAQNNSLAGTNSHTFEFAVVPYCDQISQSAVIVVHKLVDDDYNWRKYGQKQVKGSDIQGSILNVTTQNVQSRRKSNVPLMAK